MRKCDEQKPADGKAVKTINFDKIVLKRLEQRAIKERTTVSRMVNFFCSQKVMIDSKYYKAMAKYNYMKFQEFKYLADLSEQKEKEGKKGEGFL